MTRATRTVLVTGAGGYLGRRISIRRQRPNFRNQFCQLALEGFLVHKCFVPSHVPDPPLSTSVLSS